MDPKLKTALAAGGAVAALGVAVYLGFTSMGGGRTVRTASQATSQTASSERGGASSRGGEGVAPEGWTEEGAGEQRLERGAAPPGAQAALERAAAYANDYEFPDADAGAIAFEDAASDLALRAESDSGLEGLGIASRRGLVGAYRALMQPLVEGDKDAFERALRDMGAPDPSGSLALYDRLVGYLEGSRVALNAARVRKVDPALPGDLPMGMPNIPNLPSGASASVIPMMVGVMETRDESGESTTIREINIPLDGVFPGARGEVDAGAHAAEVWAPAQFAKTRGGRADLGPSIFFAHIGGEWRPIAMRVTLASEAAASRLESMMRSRRRATQD